MEITKKPFLLSFAGNPMRYLLSPDGTGGGGGQEDGILSMVEIMFTDVDATEDHAMEVAMMGETRVFTLKSQPTTKDELPVAASGWDFIRWCQGCYEYMLGDVQFSANYDMALETGKIILTAKKASPEFDMTMGDTTITGITVTTVYAGMAGTPSTVEGVMMTVLKNGVESIGEDYKPLDMAGCVKFEAQEYIYASLLQALPPRFRLQATSGYYQIYYDFLIKYRTVFCNRANGVFEARTYSDTDNLFCYALPGGLNREDLVSNNNSATNFFNLAATKKMFLTWAPQTRATDQKETFSLFFAFQSPSYSHCRLKANLYGRNSGMPVNITGLIGIAPWTVIEFMAGYTQLDLSTYLDGNVIRWELFLADENDNIISDVREFVLDQDYHENTRYFRFRNSWGAYDSFRCTGVFESNVEHEREKVAYAGDDTETPYNAPGSYTMITESQTFKANSGWLTREYQNYLRDFMLSADIYEVEDTRLLKCLLTSKKTSLFKDTDYNYALAFEYERGYDDFFFQGSD